MDVVVSFYQRASSIVVEIWNTVEPYLSAALLKTSKDFVFLILLKIGLCGPRLLKAYKSSGMLGLMEEFKSIMGDVINEVINVCFNKLKGKVNSCCSKALDIQKSKLVKKVTLTLGLAFNRTMI